MSLTPCRRLSLIASVCLGFFLASPSVVHALVVDWDAVTWNPGSTNNSLDVNGDAINDVTVTMTLQDQATWATDPATGTQTPVVNQSLTGGIAPAENSLNLSANLKTQSDVWIHISFTGVQPGAADVSFTIFDIDITTNSDIIGTIVGIALDGSFIPATITDVGSAVTLTGSGLGQTLTGNAAAANPTSHGNATLSFGSAVITDVFFNFSNSSGTHQFQNIGIGDISFTPVPEINPLAASGTSCVIAVGLAVFAHRRDKRRTFDVSGADRVE